MRKLGGQDVFPIGLEVECRCRSPGGRQGRRSVRTIHAALDADKN